MKFANEASILEDMYRIILSIQVTYSIAKSYSTDLNCIAYLHGYPDPIWKFCWNHTLNAWHLKSRFDQLQTVRLQAMRSQSWAVGWCGWPNGKRRKRRDYFSLPLLPSSLSLSLSLSRFHPSEKEAPSPLSCLCLSRFHPSEKEAPSPLSCLSFGKLHRWHERNYIFYLLHVTVLGLVLESLTLRLGIWA